MQSFKNDPKLQQLPHTVIASWYQRRGYVTAMADLIQQSLQQFQDQVCALVSCDSAHLFSFICSQNSAEAFIEMCGPGLLAGSKCASDATMLSAVSAD